MGSTKKNNIYNIYIYIYSYQGLKCKRDPLQHLSTLPQKTTLRAQGTRNAPSGANRTVKSLFLLEFF